MLRHYRLPPPAGRCPAQPSPTPRPSAHRDRAPTSSEETNRPGGDLGPRRLSVVLPSQGPPAPRGALIPPARPPLAPPRAVRAGDEPPDDGPPLTARARQVHHRLSGRTKHGTLLTHPIPVRTEHWGVTTPGCTDIDLVPHSVHTGPTARSCTRSLAPPSTPAGMSLCPPRQEPSRRAGGRAPDPVRFPAGASTPAPGSRSSMPAFHDWEGHAAQFTRGRPHKKDDTAHIDQEKWTPVHTLVGGALRCTRSPRRDHRRVSHRAPPHEEPGPGPLENWPARRGGSRLRRKDDRPHTPLDRPLASGVGDPKKLTVLQRLRARLDPCALAAASDRNFLQIFRLANPSTQYAGGASRRPSARVSSWPRPWDNGWLFRAWPSRPER